MSGLLTSTATKSRRSESEFQFNHLAAKQNPLIFFNFFTVLCVKTAGVDMLKNVLFIVLFILVTVSLAFSQQPEFSAKVQGLLDRAKELHGERYKFAVDKGAKIYQTSDKKSFYLLWFPPGADKKTIIVSLHGSNGFAFNEFYLWYEAAKKHGYGILALQWYFEGKPPADYYTPRESYDQIVPVLKELKIARGKAMFHGFSRGSANSYYLALFDRAEKTNYFGLILSNAGGAAEDYPLYREIAAEKYGKKPFEGLNWMTYCGEFDPNPEKSGCPAMRQSAKFIEKYGGSVKLVIEDKKGDHGGFLHSPENIERALELFDKLVK
jgi:hypothetical protein